MGVAQLWSLLKEADAVSILQGSLLGQHRTIVDEADGLVSPSPQESACRIPIGSTLLWGSCSRAAERQAAPCEHLAKYSLVSAMLLCVRVQVRGH